MILESAKSKIYENLRENFGEVADKIIDKVGLKKYIEITAKLLRRKSFRTRLCRHLCQRAENYLSIITLRAQRRMCSMVINHIKRSYS